MKDKLKDAKISIIDRIIRSANDSSKTISHDALCAMAKIVLDFDTQEFLKAEYLKSNNSEEPKEECTL